MAKMKSKSARDVLIDLSMTPKDSAKPKRRKSSPLKARMCDIDIRGAEKVIERFSTLKRNVDLATVGALKSSQSVFGGTTPKRRTKKKVKSSAPPFARKKRSKKAAKKTRRKAA